MVFSYAERLVSGTFTDQVTLDVTYQSKPDSNELLALMVKGRKKQTAETVLRKFVLA